MQVQQPHALPNRVATVLLVLLLCAGFYFPTSDQTGISLQLNLTSGAILLSIFVALLACKNGVIGVIPVLNIMAINITIFICTLFSPLTRFAYGGYLPILLLSALFCLHLKDINLSLTARRLFDIFNVVNVTLAALLLLRVPEVTQFFLDHYAFAYDELLPYMFEEGKPVLTFGSHSLASFFFYLLFYLNLETFIRIRSRLNVILAFCYLGLLMSMYSFSSVVLAGLALFQVVMCFQWQKSVLAGLITSAVLLAAAAIAPRVDAISTLQEDVQEIFHRGDNGLIGRYATFGGLSANFEYIVDHPFRPIGLGFSEDLWYADSGPVEYVLKGSFPLLSTVYLGAFLFFFRNLKSRSRAAFVFLIFMGFEIGYSNLQYRRTQYFLPFLVVYLNWLDTKPADTRPIHA